MSTNGLSIHKLDAVGNNIWSNLIESSQPNINFFPLALTGDNQGNIYYLFKVDSLTVDTLIYLYKCDTNGNVLYQKNISFLYPDDVFSGVSQYSLLYNNGAIFFCARENTFLTGAAVLYKVDANNGTVTWRQAYNYLGSGKARFVDLASNEAGDIWVSGDVNNGQVRGFLLRYNTFGNKVWEYITASSSNCSALAGVDIILDGNDNAYVSIAAHMGGASDSSILEKVSPSGNSIWEYKLRATLASDWQPVHLSQLSGHVIFVTNDLPRQTVTVLDSATGGLLQQWDHQAKALPTAPVNDSDRIYAHMTVPTGLEISAYNLQGDRISRIMRYDSTSILGSKVPHITFDGGNNLYLTCGIENADDDIYVGKYGNNSIPPLKTVSITKSLQPIVYPNPANDIVFVKLNTKSDISLHSITGNIVWQKQQAQNERIDVANLPQGVYILNVVDAHGNKTVSKINIMH